MKNLRYISKIATIAMVLALTFTMMIAATTAQNPANGTIETYAFVAVNPKIVGIHDQVLVTGWTSPVTGLPVGHPSHFKHGYVVTFTRPDGTTVDFDPLAGQGGITYEDGTFFANYGPDQTGEWSAVLYFPGWPEWNMTEATSEPYYFEVRDESFYEPYTEIPIPTEYWERPLPGDIRVHNNELSYWLDAGYDAGDSRWNPNTQAPDSAHILWRIENYPAGVIGGEHGSLSGLDSYAAGSTAEGYPILGGYAYILPWRGQTSHRMIDMDTGEEIWRKEFEGSVHFAVQPYQDLPHYRGINYVIYEAFNGEMVRVLNAHTAEELLGSSFAGGTVVDDRVGFSAYHEGYIYYTGQSHLLKWEPNVPGSNLNDSSSFTTFTVHNKTVYRVPRPAGATAPQFYSGDLAVGGMAQTGWNLTTGEVLWIADPDDYDPGASNNRFNSNNWEAGTGRSAGYGLLFIHNLVERRTYAFDMATGEVAWRTEPRETPYGAFHAYQMAVGEGLAIVESYDGHVYAYNVTNGNTEWAFYAGDAGLEMPYNTWPFWHAPAIADGMVFASNSEHSAQNPYYRGTRMFAIDSGTGEEVWSIGGAWAGKSIADNKLLVQCESTGELYCFARGPTETTVSIKNDVVPKGNKVLITGSVLDTSPGTEGNELQKRFPNGVPAVSEDIMSEYMEYLYLKRPIAHEAATGVPLIVAYLDPNGNYGEITRITTDVTGYRVEWTPEIEGIYQIFATFEGSTSYWPSHAETSILVGPAPPTGGPIEPEPEAPLISTEVAIIAAIAIIAIIGVGAYLYLRKR